MSVPSASDPSGALSTYLFQLDALETAYDDANTAYADIKDSRNRADDNLGSQRADEEQAQLQKSLGGICDIARSASENGRLLPGELLRLAERAAEIENMIIKLSFAVGHEGGHIACGNLIKEDGLGELGGSMGSHTAKNILRLTLRRDKELGRPSSKQELSSFFFGCALTPYKDMPKPSPYTSPLARFALNPVIPVSTSPVITAFTEARCEIQSREIDRPATMLLANGNIVILGAGGRKEQGGVLTICDLTSEGGSALAYTEKAFSLGRHGGAQAALDEARRLVYVGGDKAISVYRWDDEGDGDGEDVEYINQDDEQEQLYSEDADRQRRPTFFLQAKDYGGVLDLTADRTKVLRSGRNGLGVWDVSSLDPSGIANFNSIASSAFSEVHTWSRHPSDQHQRLVAGSNRSCRVSSADIETGKAVMHYVGQNTGVGALAVGKDDPHNFFTASAEGGVRFYDSRTPAPIYVLQHAGGDNIQSLLYEHIGGHPFIIIGGNQSQQIKIWDARARAPLYQLSTGNNAVETLAWDGERNQLYAATNCQYLGYDGSFFGYRGAHFGDEDDDGGDWRWPREAWHDEKSFGHPFDCGSHRLIRYSFKSEPNPEFSCRS
ncbi:unnamed protein product [Peniophora sp. CBMAI 1063]|nr:unnamed protein product [Peniophora sp. CBMAI 1063]